MPSRQCAAISRARSPGSIAGERLARERRRMPMPPAPPSFVFRLAPSAGTDRFAQQLGVVFGEVSGECHQGGLSIRGILQSGHHLGAGVLLTGLGGRKIDLPRRNAGARDLSLAYQAVENGQYRRVSRLGRRQGGLDGLCIDGLTELAQNPQHFSLELAARTPRHYRPPTSRSPRYRVEVRRWRPQVRVRSATGCGSNRAQFEEDPCRSRPARALRGRLLLLTRWKRVPRTLNRLIVRRPSSECQPCLAGARWAVSRRHRRCRQSWLVKTVSMIAIARLRIWSTRCCTSGPIRPPRVGSTFKVSE